MNKAQVENGIVVNIITVDPDSIPDWCSDWPEATEGAEIGGTYADGVFTPLPKPPAPEVPPPVPTSISFAQLLTGLVTEQWITEDEGLLWLAGTLPQQVLDMIATLPAEQQFAAKARAIRPSEVLRNDPLVISIGAAAGKTEAEIDTFFRTYAAI